MHTTKMPHGDVLSQIYPSVRSSLTCITLYASRASVLWTCLVVGDCLYACMRIMLQRVGKLFVRNTLRLSIESHVRATRNRMVQLLGGYIFRGADGKTNGTSRSRLMLDLHGIMYNKEGMLPYHLGNRI